MAQGILLDTSGLLEVKVEDEYFRVSYGFHQFAWFHEKDEAAKRVVVVQLTNMGVKKTQIASAFGVQRSSIYVWMGRYQEKGIEGVVSMAKGRESKFTEAIKDYICALHKSLLGDRS
ncbi:MAG: helix-turn-helix domain-containing protein, partial [Pirellulales bacterium]|nr:helix-turn-helix domain-containing protein [Pirellulales bacterium]